MKFRCWMLPLVVGFALGACGDEGPTAVGGHLVPADVETFELVLPASRLVDIDTTVRGMTRPVEAGFTVVARQFEGALDSNTLLQFEGPPTTVFWRDGEGGEHRIDEPEWVAGELRLTVDTMWTDVSEPLGFEVRPVTEEWDPVTATWEYRFDQAERREAWSQPGGTTAPLPNLAQLEPEEEMVAVPLDSATVNHWLSEADAARGALVTLTDSGRRAFIVTAQLILKTRPEEQPDTLVDAGLAVLAATYVFNPPQAEPAADELRVGGLPSWRTMLRLRPRLDTLSVPCPAQGGGMIDDCLRLGDLQVNRAVLLLTPLEVPAHFVPVAELELEVRGAFSAPDIPISRAPIGGRVNAVNPRVAPDRFREAPAAPVEMGLTEIIFELSRPPGQRSSGIPSLLALLAVPEHAIGYGSFGGVGAGDSALRVRLVVTRGEAVGIR